MKQGGSDARAEGLLADSGQHAVRQNNASRYAKDHLDSKSRMTDPAHTPAVGKAVATHGVFPPWQVPRLEPH